MMRQNLTRNVAKTPTAKELQEKLKSTDYILHVRTISYILHSHVWCPEELVVGNGCFRA